MTKRSKQITSTDTAALPTLMDHLKELQGRLFSTVLIFLLIASAAYPFFGTVTEFLMAPLKQGQELVYLTPGGAFSFIIKVCAFIGLIGVLPVLIFHLYRFFMPAVRQVLLRTVLGYTVASFFLAIVGVAFAYYVMLPAALQFLTGFNLNHINPMLTIDSYFAFIMTYMFAGAILFQLPLVMLIINSATPLTPSKLMKAQGKIIVGSFIIAAAISPTPDAINQSLLASPLVVMYQIGIILIAIKNRKLSRKATKKPAKVAHAVTTPVVVLPLPAQPQPELSTIAIRPQSQSEAPFAGGKSRPKSRKVMDIAVVRPLRPATSRVVVPNRNSSLGVVVSSRPVQPVPVTGFATQSMDGVLRVRRAA